MKFSDRNSCKVSARNEIIFIGTYCAGELLKQPSGHENIEHECNKEMITEWFKQTFKMFTPKDRRIKFHRDKKTH
jgi:hypothetical protein